MYKVGIIGWRGMVGSVLINRMIEENDFNNFDPFFFSTSKIGNTKLEINKKLFLIENAYDFKKLAFMDIIISCQGSQYTRYAHKKLRDSKWNGYWIDSSSELRMKKESIIVLDPINIDNIISALSEGILDYIGSNCTASLMLMALDGLIKNDWIEWITSMTYQAISGAGAKELKKMVIQMKEIGVENTSQNTRYSSTIIDEELNNVISQVPFPLKNKKFDTNPSMAANLIPWIGTAIGNGQTKEEWKAFSEVNKILGLSKKNSIPIDGQCVRVCTIRCHSQALTFKLKKQISMHKIKDAIRTSNKWVKLIENDKDNTISKLNPTSVSGTLNIAIGRLRKLNVGKGEYITAFTVGDQLLWGATEPIRRTLKIILDYISQNSI